jgi:CheY-like chemotaxis protein
MPTRSAFALVNTLAEHAIRIGAESLDALLGAQAAVVRTLVDEVQHLDPSSIWVAPLHAQLAEELARLENLIVAQSSKGHGDAGEEIAAQGPPQVLVVDDELPALGATASALRGWGYPYRTAHSAEEALRQNDEHPAEIVLCDWSLPGMNGLDLCLALKHREPRPYVILVTGFADEKELLEGARGSVDDFLPKPLDLGDLERRLSAARELVRALRSATALRDRLHSTRPPPLRPCWCWPAAPPAG